MTTVGCGFARRYVGLAFGIFGCPSEIQRLEQISIHDHAMSSFWTQVTGSGGVVRAGGDAAVILKVVAAGRRGAKWVSDRVRVGSLVSLPV